MGVGRGWGINKEERHRVKENQGWEEKRRGASPRVLTISQTG